MKEYGRVRWINSYEEAPEDAYVVRELFDSSVRLEHYANNCCEVLRDFPCFSFSEVNFKDTLTRCRTIMGNRRTLWVEVPFWFNL